MLETPDAALSETKLPISIPIAINSTAIIIDAKTVQIIFMLNCNPKNIAIINNNISCNKMIGINEIIYPNIYSIGFIGLIPNRVSSDVVLSFEISIAVKSVINEKLNIIIPGVKFSSLYASFGILNC